MNIGDLGIESPLLSLPDEVKMHVLNYLTDVDLTKRISLVCKDLRRVSYDERLWKKRTIQRFGKTRANESYYELGDKKGLASWKTIYIALRKLELTKIKKVIEKKQKVDDLQQRTMRVASSIFGFNVNPNQSHYYPAQSSTAMFGGKVRKITVYKPN